MARLHHADLSDALRLEHRQRLVDEIDGRHREQDLLAFGHSALDERRRQNRLAPSGRGLHADAPLAERTDRLAQHVERCRLILA